VGHHQTLQRLLPRTRRQLYKLHKQLDALVLQAYGFSPDDDLLEKLLALNLELAEKEKSGGAVVGPWDPTQSNTEA
jgi:hypothetical protein